MPLDVAHGFLTATAASGDAADSLFACALDKPAGDAGLSELLARFRDQLVDDLQRAEYGPLILQMPRDDGGMLPLPNGWCQGYVAGLEFLGDERRDAPMADSQAGGLLAPLLALLMYDEDQYFDPPNEAAHRETVGKLGEAAVGLFNWWLAREPH
ncbi:MAG: UPF0149 family protein [Gammaproteobacteria bacterium]|nr:UPF0149 family protein [Gammaproteobacteria bacterium]